MSTMMSIMMRLDEVVFMTIASHVRLGKVDCVFVASHGPRKASEW